MAVEALRLIANKQLPPFLLEAVSLPRLLLQSSNLLSTVSSVSQSGECGGEVLRVGFLFEDLPEQGPVFG